MKLTRKTGYNRHLAKKRVQYLNEVWSFVSSLVLADSFVLRNPLLRQAPKRCAKVSAPLQLLHIEARITSAAVSKRFRCRKNLQHICGLAKFPQESKLSEETSPIRASLAVRLKDDTETETNGIYKTTFQNKQKTK